jgi:hypothetical protein
MTSIYSHYLCVNVVTFPQSYVTHINSKIATFDLKEYE